MEFKNAKNLNDLLRLANIVPTHEININTGKSTYKGHILEDDVAGDKILDTSKAGDDELQATVENIFNTYKDMPIEELLSQFENNIPGVSIQRIKELT